VSESKGKISKIFLINGFRYEGRITNYDEECVEILDFKIKGYKILRYKDIKDIEVRE
jgi:sRNA-binding regulator protein Hfq